MGIPPSSTAGDPAESPGPSADAGVSAAALAPALLYLDDDVVVVHKPSGLLVHPTGLAPDRVTLMSLLRDRLGRHVYPVHRLDRAASGALMLGLSSAAASSLAAAHREGRVHKRYEAIVRGWVAERGRIERPLDDKPSATRWRRLGRAELPFPSGGHATSRYAWVEVVTESGRLHQIRRHFNGAAHPLIGDTVYGQGLHNRHFRERFGIHRLLLAATELEFPHPCGGGRIRVAASRPPEFERIRSVFMIDQG